MAECVNCRDQFPAKRAALGYKTCLRCGERDAREVKHTIAPLHKGHYTVISNKEDLIGINNKTIR